MITKITLKCHTCDHESIHYSDALATNEEPNEIRCPYCFSRIEDVWLKDLVDIVSSLDKLNSDIYHKNNSKSNIGTHIPTVPFTISLEPCISIQDIEGLEDEI